MTMSLEGYQAVVAFQQAPTGVPLPLGDPATAAALPAGSPCGPGAPPRPCKSSATATARGAARGAIRVAWRGRSPRPSRPAAPKLGAHPDAPGAGGPGRSSNAAGGRPRVAGRGVPRRRPRGVRAGDALALRRDSVPRGGGASSIRPSNGLPASRRAATTVRKASGALASRLSGRREAACRGEAAGVRPRLPSRRQRRPRSPIDVRVAPVPEARLAGAAPGAGEALLAVYPAGASRLPTCAPSGRRAALVSRPRGAPTPPLSSPAPWPQRPPGRSPDLHGTARRSRLRRGVVSRRGGSAACVWQWRV